MNILILHFLPSDSSRHTAIVKKLEQAVAAQGHSVSVVPALTDGDTFSDVPYTYITVVVPCQGVFSSKLAPKVSEVFARCRTLGGKKAAALVVKTGLFAEKTCRNLMRAMEKEGMFVDYFEVLQNAEQAAYAGGKIG